MESAPTAVREGLRPCGGVYGRAGLRDDASIVLYTGLRCRKIAVSRLAAGPVRFAGPCTAATGPIWNRPLQRRGRGCGQAAAFMAGRGLRDDASIVPYTGLQCRKIAVFRLAAGPVRFAGNDLDRSAGPCAAATGPIWNRPLRRCGRGCCQVVKFMAGRGPRRDEGIPPYGCFVGFAGRERRPLLTRETPVGADSISARGVGGVAKQADMESAPTAVREGLRPCGGVYGGAGARQMRHCCIPHKEIYARRRKLRAYILRDIGRGARFSAARLCG